MGKNQTTEFAIIETDTLIIHTTEKISKISMGSRTCDNCGHTKDTAGGKTCKNGHFLCHSCASRHIHCTLCGHTLR